MSRRHLLASTLTLLAACGPAAMAMPAKPPKPEVPPPARVGLRIAPGAVGPATTTTPFSAAALRRLFPASSVRAAVPPGGGGAAATLLVTGPDDLWIAFTGEQGTLFGAVVRGSEVRGPAGEKAGDNSGALGFAPGDCQADARSRTVTCRRPDAPQLAYVFDARGIKGDRLVRFVWTADAP